MKFEALKHMQKTTPELDADLITENQTDVGNANTLVHLHEDKIRYCPEYGKWLVWNGQFWEIDYKHTLNELAKDVTKKLLINAAENYTHDKEQAVKHALRSEQQTRIKAMVELAKSDPRIQISSSALDKNKTLLNTLNGTLDLETGKLKPHNQEDLITRVTQTEFDSSKKSELFEKFIDEITCGDKDLAESLQILFGHYISGHVREHVLTILIGEGSNGKSTLLNVVLEILGAYAKQVPSSILLETKNEKHPTDIASLKGVRFASVSESDSGKSLSEAQVKSITGGDRLTARFMNQDFFEFEPEHKIVMATNFLPEIKGRDYGIWRRIKVVPFNAKISTERVDNKLKEKLLSEGPAILNWLLEGYQKYLENGLKDCPAMNAAKAAYRDETDILKEFLDECCDFHPNANEKFSDLYRCYVAWCKDNGERAISRKQLGLHFQKRGIHNFSGPKNASYRRGISLKV